MPVTAPKRLLPASGLLRLHTMTRGCVSNRLGGGGRGVTGQNKARSQPFSRVMQTDNTVVFEMVP